MNKTLLNKEIVETRKKRAPELEKMMASADNLHTVVQTVMHSPLVRQKPKEGDAYLKKLATLCETLANKVALFKNGVITVSVAGVEKSGKTTLLKNLTGIDKLPTSDERCTSVSCEIKYVASPAQECLDIVYYSRDELLQVICAQLSYLRNAEDLWAGNRAISLPELPTDVESFLYSSLPPKEAIAEEMRLLYEGALLQLSAIQGCIKKHANRLGTIGRDEISNLPLYASHKTSDNEFVSELQPIIRKITIHKHFIGGAEFLRLCDTPGIDDPNPQALEHTISAIKSETDLLIIANRPGNTPSITGPLSKFISNLKRLDTSAPLRDRSIFFVNWHKSVDPTGRNAEIRIQKVKENNVFASSSIYGPCDVMNANDIQQFLNHVNSRLLNDVPRQDEELIRTLTREWKSIQASVRTQVLDALRSQAPPMPEQMQRTMDDEFDRWFSRRYDTQCENPRSQTEYFMECLSIRIKEATRNCRSHPALEERHRQVKSIRDEKLKEIKAWIEDEASPEKCGIIINANQGDPEKVILPQLAVKMTALVQLLTAVVEEIGPVVQEEVYKVISEALGNEVAQKLCPGNTPAECLNALCSKLESSSGDKDVAFITKNLREFANIPMQMRCIMRHELRPALNLFDSLRWHADRREELIKEVSGIVKEDRCKQWLSNAKLPSLSDAPKSHSGFFKNLFSTGMLVIDEVLTSNSNKFAKLMDDYMSDASQTLVTQVCCENGWRKGLRSYGNIILADTWTQMAAKSENSTQFAALVGSLEDALDL